MDARVATLTEEVGEIKVDLRAVQERIESLRELSETHQRHTGERLGRLEDLLTEALRGPGRRHELCLTKLGEVVTEGPARSTLVALAMVLGILGLLAGVVTWGDLAGLIPAGAGAGVAP